MANLFNTAAKKVSDFANLDKVQALESEYGAGSTGLPSDARHMAAMNQLSNAIAIPINKISEPLGTFVGDTGAFAAGLINEIPGVYRSIKGEAPIKDVWEDIAANWKGSFGTPNITTSEEIYKDVYGIPSIDPTGRNLFTQYYEDDPYAGIQGQTAFLGLPQLLGMITKGGISKKAIQKAIIRDQIGKQIGKKTRPFIAKKIREASGEKFGGTGKFKNIATGTKDYGPHTKPKTKPKTKTKPIPDRGRGNGGGGSRPNKSGRSGFTNPGKGSYGPHKADGGLIRLFKYGGFSG